MVVAFLLLPKLTPSNQCENMCRTQPEHVEDLELVRAEMTTFCNKKVLFCSIYWPDPDGDTGCWQAGKYFS